MTTTGLRDSTIRGDSLLGDHPVNDLRQLELAETESEIVITGVVRSYYLKRWRRKPCDRPSLAAASGIWSSSSQSAERPIVCMPPTWWPDDFRLVR